MCSYDHHAMVGVLTGQAVSAGALAIGEDLGTVDPWIREYLADRGVLGHGDALVRARPGRGAAPAGQVAA